MIFGHILVGLLAVGFGVVSLKYNYQLVSFTGHIEYVERYLGYGSTYAFMKMLSVLVAICGFMYMFGLFTPVFHWVLSPLAYLFRGGRSQ